MESTTETTGAAAEAPVPKRKRYKTVRGDIKDGDVLLWGGNYLLSRMVRDVTKSPYSHAAIVAWWGERLMILEAGTFGVHTVPFSVTVRHYDGRVDWYRIKPELRSDVDKIKKLLDCARENLGLGFGVGKAFRALARRLLRLPFSRSEERRRPRELFCSEYVSRCFREAGMDLDPERGDSDTLPVNISRSPVIERVDRLHW